MDFRWERWKENVLTTLDLYFGWPKEKTLELIEKRSPSKVHIDYVSREEAEAHRNYRERLVAIVGALSHFCGAGQPAYVDGVAQANISDRMKSGEAILSNLRFADDEPLENIHYRLKDLYKSISEKGIDIYKTIYVTSLTEGNPREFENVYRELRSVLRLSQVEANAVVEKCAATIISKVSASNISAMYQTMLSLTLFCEDNKVNYYFFRHDREFEGLKRSLQKSKMIDAGLVNCPTIFSCKPENVRAAFDYVARKIPEDLIEKEYLRFKSAGNTTMTRFWCKYQIMRKWINNNFSLLTINSASMGYKESTLHELAVSLNDRVYRGGKDTHYSFGFLFNNPVGISTMNSIPLEKIDRYAKSNIETLEKYTDEKGVIEYIKRNHYVLAMDNAKLEKLMQMISAHDAINPDNPCMERFFLLGKTLFGSKHCINFDVEKTIDRLRQIEKIQILDVEHLDDWGRLAKFNELFLGNDPTFVNQVQRLYHEKLQKEKRGSVALRKQIRTLLIKNGGWDAILKDTRKMKEVTSEVKCINDQRFVIEQVEKTENIFNDIVSLQMKEDTFADAIKGVLARVRNAYTANKDKLNKRFTDIDKLYEYTIEFLTERCFDDKEPISTLIEEELRSPLVDTLKTMDGTFIDPQQSLFGNERVIVPAPEPMYGSLRNLSRAISVDSSTKMESDRIEIVKSKDEGK